MIHKIWYAVSYSYYRYKLIGYTFTKYDDSVLCKKILIYSSWNMTGIIAQILRNQGINITLNIFFAYKCNSYSRTTSQLNCFPDN